MSKLTEVFGESIQKSWCSVKCSWQGIDRSSHQQSKYRCTSNVFWVLTLQMLSIASTFRTYWTVISKCKVVNRIRC